MDASDLAVGGGLAAACQPCMLALGCDPAVALALAVAIGVGVQVLRLTLPALVARLRQPTSSNAKEPS